MRNYRKTVAAALLLAAGCVSVNVYLNFPALEQAMHKMEKEVRGTDSDVPNPPPSDNPQKMVGDDEDAQGEPDVNVQTGPIKEINKERKARFPEIARLMDQGLAAEGQDCMLHARSEAMDAQNARARKEALKVIEKENDDRGRLLTEICKANKIDDKDEVKRRYFNVLRKEARIGWYVEFEKGKFRPKTKEDKN
jgi:hypothetical protein